ncbi:MAG: ArsA-related P-loop ATPase [bacterium]
MIVTGKGGVGKSTVSLALALAAAARGKRTILCEVSAQEQFSRVFHRAEVGFHEVEMADNLWGISIDPDESIKEYLLIQLKLKAMRDLLVNSRIFSYLAAATPGLRELVTFGKVWELAQPDRRVKGAQEYDLVVLDAPATGQGVGFLQTPRTFAAVARVGPIRSQAETLDAYITNHRKTGVAIVALPEEMPVNESAHLEQQLTEVVGASVDRIFMNGLYPERFSGDEVARLEPLAAERDGAVAAACRAAVGQSRRAATQREQLTRLEQMTSAPLNILPFIFEPKLGLEQIRWLAEQVGV